MFIIFLRYFIGIPYAIYNFTCYEGELSIYILSSLFVFLSTFWAFEILVRLKNNINSIYGKTKPFGAALYERIVIKMSTSIIAKLAFHGSAFIFGLVIPLVIRLNPKNYPKH